MSKLTEQEIEAIRKEAEALYPQGIAVGDIDLKPLVIDIHIAAVTAERERAKDETAGDVLSNPENFFYKNCIILQGQNKGEYLTKDAFLRFAAQQSPTYPAEFVEPPSDFTLWVVVNRWQYDHVQHKWYNTFIRYMQEKVLTHAELFQEYLKQSK